MEDRTARADEPETVHHRVRAWDAVFLIVLVLFGCLMWWRASFGMEWYGDEAYSLATPTRYVQGDRPITESWESHFSSGVLLTPVVWVLDKVDTGGGGLVLDYRHVFVVMQLAYVLALWLLLRGLAPPWLTAVIGWTVMWYLPYYYLFPYYNTLAVAAFLLAVTALYRAVALQDRRRSRTLVTVAGALFAVGVIAYPTMLIALPFFSTGLFLSPGRRDAASERWRLVGRFVVVSAAVLAGFATLVLVWAGPSHVVAALPEFLTPADRDMSIGAIVARFARTRALLGPFAVAVTLFVVAHVAASRSPRRNAIAIVVAVAGSALAAFLGPRLPHTFLYYMDVPQAAALGAAALVPALLLAERSDLHRRLFWMLTIPSVGLAAGTAIASHEGFETASMPAIIGVVAVLLAFSHAWGLGDTSPRYQHTRTALALGTGVLLILFLATSMEYSGGDATLPHLSAAIESGPYAGVKTTSDNRDRYRHELGLFGGLDAPGRIAFVEEYPTGYLLAGRRPGTYSVWTTFSAGDRWQRYLDLTGNHPAYIVATTVRGPNGGTAPEPFRPPYGLRDFDARYREVHAERDFVVYERRR